MQKKEILEALRSDAEEQRQIDLSEGSRRDVRLAVGKIVAARERSASSAGIPWALMFRRAAVIGIPAAVAALLLVYVSNINFSGDPNDYPGQQDQDTEVAARALELERNVDKLHAELRSGIGRFHEKYLASSKQEGVSVQMDLIEQRIRESVMAIERELELTKPGVASPSSGSS